MTMSNERFSGHESFVCRYGWLPKIFRAVSTMATFLKDEERAMITLGIGRNMVKSLQFWAETTGIIETDGEGGYRPGPIGKILFGENGWDPHLESLESLWLIHWRLTTKANLAAWNEVFGSTKLVRFERPRLISCLAEKGMRAARALAPSTLEQHASILINSYLPASRSNDDSSWCPLQDLGILRASKTDDGRISYSTQVSAPVGLSLRVFSITLVDYMASRTQGKWNVDLHAVLKGENSPGVVYRMDEYQLRFFIESCVTGPLKDALRFIDTADTQTLVIQPEKLGPEYCSWAQDEVHDHA